MARAFSTRAYIPVVMIGSTYRDLQEHRNVARDACQLMRALALPMETEPPSPKDKVTTSMELVDSADVFVGIIGSRYGDIPGGYNKSIPELEYERATLNRLDLRVFVMDDSSRAKLQAERGEVDSARLDAFIDRVNKEVTTREFTSTADLELKIVCALADHLLHCQNLATHHSVSDDQFDLWLDERREWMRRLFARHTPENCCRAAIGIADSACAGMPVSQIATWLDNLDWQAVLRHIRNEHGGGPTPGQEYTPRIAKAICDLREQLLREKWDEVRSELHAAFSDDSEPYSSEAYTLLLRAISLENQKTAQELLVPETILVDKLTDRRTTIVRRELTSLMQPQRQAGLRVALDVWPGYFPLFVMEDRLHSEAGITLLDVESSSAKIRLLREQRVDLVATTPGCLIGLNTTGLDELRLVAILNESAGADQMLIRGSKWSRQQSPWPDAEELSAATWIVTAGSTSELFARAVAARFRVQVPENRWLRTQNYHDALDAITHSRGVAVCSTWEPYSSWMCEQSPGISLLCSTADFEPLVVDCLVASRAIGFRELDERVEPLMRVWNECVEQVLYMDSASIQAVCNRFVRFAPEDYQRMVGGVRYFTSKKMQEQALSGEFRSVFVRVAELWKREDVLKKDLWRELVHPGSRWLPV